MEELLAATAGIGGLEAFRLLLQRYLEFEREMKPALLAEAPILKLPDRLPFPKAPSGTRHKGGRFGGRSSGGSGFGSPAITL